MFDYTDYIQFYHQAKKNGHTMEMEYLLMMITTSCSLEYLRYRLNNTMPYFQDLVPHDAIDPYQMIMIRINIFKRKGEDQIVRALEKAIEEEMKWKRWFLDPKTRAANCIQRAWRKAIDNPNTEVGKSHLCRDFENFQKEFSTDFV
jgi:hypothetical protein